VQVRKKTWVSRYHPNALRFAFTELMGEAGRMWELVPKDRRVLRTDKHATYPGSLSSVEPGEPRRRGGDRPHNGETGAATAIYRRAFISRSRLHHVPRQVWADRIPTPERQNRINRRLTPAYCLSYVPYTCTVVDSNRPLQSGPVPIKS